MYNIVSSNKFKQAIKSVLGQSYRNIELLLVNDGSSDESQSILEKMKTDDSRIKLITKPNGGVESARRAGLKIASGEYVFHMDQDDLLECHAIEKMVQCAEKNKADVVVGTSKRFIANKKFSKGEKRFSETIYLTHEEFMKQYYVGFFGIYKFPVQIWNKLYRKKFIDSIPEPPTTGLYNEDLNYNMHILPNANRIIWIPDVTYYYRWGAFTCKKIETLEETALSCYRIKMKQIEKMNLWEFENSICIELLNYINSAIYQEIEYEDSVQESFEKYCERLFSFSEVQHAIEIVRKTDYRNRHIELMIQNDISGLEKYERDIFAKNKIKRLLKRIF